MVLKTNKIKENFTISVDYSLKEKGVQLSISLTKNDKMYVKVLECKRKLSQAKILKIVNEMLKEEEKNV